MISEPNHVDVTAYGKKKAKSISINLCSELHSYEYRHIDSNGNHKCLLFTKNPFITIQLYSLFSCINESFELKQKNPIHLPLFCYRYSYSSKKLLFFVTNFQPPSYSEPTLNTQHDAMHDAISSVCVK